MASGTLSAVDPSRELLNMVGGQALLAPQYLADSSFAESRPAPRSSACRGGSGGGCSSSTGVGGSRNGMPRGADLYEVVHDGEPDAFMEPPGNPNTARR